MGISTLISLIALVASLLAVFYSYKNYSDAAGSAAIQESYRRFYDMNSIGVSNSDISHIYALPSMYAVVRQQVEEANAGLSREQKLKLVLKERSIALYVFTVFEEIFLLEAQSWRFGHFQRRDYYQDMLNYLTGSLLRNPRLLYYLSPKGAGLLDYLEADTQKYLREKLEQALDPGQFDGIGPFLPDSSK